MRQVEARFLMKRLILLKNFLRYVGTVCLLAMIAVVMPRAWMEAIHHWLGLGDLPDPPIVAYMARMLSAFYALFGGLLWVVSGEVSRWVVVVRYLGWAMIFFGGITLAVDWQVGLPTYWIALEGPMVMAFGAFIVWLARGLGRSTRDL